MAANLRHPTRMVPLLVAKWKEGYEDIYGILTKGGGQSISARINLMSDQISDTVSKLPTPQKSSNFPLADRRAHETLNGPIRNRSFK